MHSQLRKDENIYGECLQKEKYGEARHQKRSRLDSPLDVNTVSHYFDDEQNCRCHGGHEEQEYENPQC